MMDRPLRLLAVAALLSSIVAFSGCRGGIETDYLEHELRHQEDRVYALQDTIAEYESRLESTRRENEALRRELGLDAAGAAPLGSGRNGGPPVEIPSITPPMVDPGIPLDVPNLNFPIDPPPAETQPDAEQTGLFQRATPSISDAAPAEIIFNKMLTGGLDTDGRPGDEGVMVVIEPRSADGELVRPLGDLSLMLLDPRLSEPGNRVARWDFSNEDAQLAWKETLLGRGMHFELPWSATPPPAGEMELWARLITPSGEKFLASTMIQVDSSGIARTTGSSQVPGASSSGVDGFISRRTESTGWSQHESAQGSVQRTADASSTPSLSAGETSAPARSTTLPVEPRTAPANTSGTPSWSPER